MNRASWRRRRKRRHGDNQLEPESNPTPDDVESEGEPPERAPDGIEGEEWLGLTPPD